MKMNKITQALSLGLLVVHLSGCGSDSNSSTPPSEPPQIPIEGMISGAASALSFNLITLEAQVTGEGALSYQWEQTSGPAATISGQDSSTLRATLPNLEEAQTLDFSVTVMDASQESRTFEHSIVVQPTVAGATQTMVDVDTVVQSVNYDMNKDGVLDVVQLLDNRHIVVHYAGNESVETVDIARDMPDKITAMHLWDADKDNDTDFFMLNENSEIVVLTQTDGEFEFTVGGDSGVVSTQLSECLDGQFFAQSASLTTDGNNGIYVRCSVFDTDIIQETSKDFLLVQNANGFDAVVPEVVRTETSHPSLFPNGYWVDINNDGNTDFIPPFHNSVEAMQGLPVYLGDGSGTLTSQEIMPSFVNEDGRVSIRRVLDMNSDGLLDFVVDETVVDATSGVQFKNTIVKLGQENGSFQDVVVLENNFTNWSTTGANDYNQDGLIDIAGCDANRCAIFVNAEGEYQESFEVRINASSGFDAFQLLSVDADEQSEQTHLYYVEGQDLFVASLTPNSDGVASATVRSSNQVPLHQRQPSIQHCDFSGQSGVCVDDISVRLVSNDGTLWQGDVISNRGFSDVEALSYTDLDGDTENDVHYLSSGADPSFPSFFESHQAYLSATDYTSTPLPFIDLLPNRFTLLNADDDAEKEMLTVNRSRSQDVAKFYDDITAGVAPVDVPLLFDNGTEETSVVFGGDLTAAKHGDDSMVFIVGGANGSPAVPDVQLRMFRLDDSGASMKLLQEQRINLDVPATGFQFARTDVLVPVIDVKDLDGDGNLDVLYHHKHEQSVSIYAFSFIDGRLGEQRSIWSETCEATDEHGNNLDIDVRYADIDLDGDLDIVSSCGNSRVYLQTGDAQFQLFQTLPHPIMDISDVDGDSDPDFIFLNNDLGYYENTIQ